MPEQDHDGERRASPMEIAFARFEGAMTAELRNLTHDVRGLTQSLGAYALDRDVKATETRLDERIEKVERSVSFVGRTIASAAIGAIVSGAGYLISLVLKGAHP